MDKKKTEEKPKKKPRAKRTEWKDKDKPWVTRSSPLDSKNPRKIYSDGDKKQIISYAIARKFETPRISITSIAKELEMPERTLCFFLADDKKWGKYITEQKKLFDTQALSAMQSGVRRIREKIDNASLTQATITVGVLHDKVFGNDPIAEVKVGDNREIKVYYPNFKPPDEAGK